MERANIPRVHHRAPGCEALAEHGERPTPVTGFASIQDGTRIADRNRAKEAGVSIAHALERAAARSYRNTFDTPVPYEVPIEISAVRGKREGLESTRVSRDMTRDHVTRLLHRIREGDRSALDELMPLVYGELKRLARSVMRRQSPGHTLQPTALVNEAFIKLFQGAEPHVVDRAHFLALMARVMRQVLVDHARAHVATKRGGDQARVPWDSNVEVRAEDATEQLKVLDLHTALETLERKEPLLAQVVEMHYFGGMTAEEAAVAVGRSVHVVRHEIRAARAWLRRELSR